MRRLTKGQFEAEQDAFAAAVSRTEYLAKFCTNAPWQLAALGNLHGEEFGIQEPRETLIVEENGNWVVFAERNERVFFPLEAAWMFGCPLVGEPAACIDLLRRAAAGFIGDTCGFIVSGVRSESPMQQQLQRFAENAIRFEAFDTTDCMTIDLADGAEAFLARKSRSFRKSIRQMKDLEGLDYEDASKLPPDQVLERIIAIQARSHKAETGGDIFSDSRYQNFYRDLYGRLFAQEAIHTLFARIPEVGDIAYIMGGVSDGVYRGFQMSYDESYRQYALGNRLQLENIRQMSEQGVAHYDLGMHSPYKERWADDWEKYEGIFLVF